MRRSNGAAAMRVGGVLPVLLLLIGFAVPRAEGRCVAARVAPRLRAAAGAGLPEGRRSTAPVDVRGPNVVATPKAAVEATKYLVVFVDGRLLTVSGTRVLDQRRIRLELSDGGAVIVPLDRVDRVIEADIDPEPKPIPPPVCSPEYASQPLPQGLPYAKEIRAASRRNDLHPWLVAAVIDAESRFDRWAVSRVGARGLMQLMPAVWEEEGVLDPHDPRANIEAGCRHLRALLNRFGSLKLALAAYNAGAGAVDAYDGVPPYRETRGFLRRVLAHFCPPNRLGAR